MPEGRLMDVKSELRETDQGGKKRVYLGKVLPLTPNYPVVPFSMDNKDVDRLGKEPKDKMLVEFRKLANRNTAAIEKILD